MIVYHKASILTLFVAGATLATLSFGGCTDDDEVLREMPGGGGGGGSTATGGQLAPLPELTRPERDNSLGVVPVEFPAGSRDPLVREFPVNYWMDNVDSEVEGPIDIGPGNQSLNMGPLANYPAESLQLIGIITRRAETMAYFLVPDGQRLAYLARENDRVGPNGTGRISAIRPNEVEISYEGFGLDPTEQDRTQILRLRDRGAYPPADFDEP